MFGKEANNRSRTVVVNIFLGWVGLGWGYIRGVYSSDRQRKVLERQAVVFSDQTCGGKETYKDGGLESKVAPWSSQELGRKLQKGIFFFFFKENDPIFLFPWENDPKCQY